MKFDIHKPKLNRNLIRAIANKKIELTKTATNLLFILAQYIDHDSRIHIDKEFVKKKVFCDRRTLEKALDELCNASYKDTKLLTYENGYYVSHFHLASSGESTYLKFLPVFLSKEFQELTLNQTRLFLYIVTLNIPNEFTKVAIENLYKNKLHDKKFGMFVYDDYKSVAEDLFVLLEKELISVRLPGKKDIFDSNDPDYKNVFHEVCGYKDNKKSRTSKYHKLKHVIGLKTNNEVFKAKAVPNESGKAEIRALAEQYHMYHEDMNEETLNFLVGKKNKLMSQFGEAGFEIYSSSLKKYFKEKNEFILYYDRLGKAENYFADFYLLEEIKEVILGGLRSELGERRALEKAGYPFSKTDIPLLVEYFVANSSDEHKVLIDQDIQLIHKAHEIIETSTSEEPWKSLQESIQVVYTKYTPGIKNMFKETCEQFGITNAIELFDHINEKELIISLAKNSQLSQQKETDELAQRLKQIVRFFRKKQIPFSFKPTEEESPEEREASEARKAGIYYNWLEEDA